MDGALTTQPMALAVRPVRNTSASSQSPPAKPGSAACLGCLPGQRGGPPAHPDPDGGPGYRLWPPDGDRDVDAVGAAQGASTGAFSGRFLVSTIKAGSTFSSPQPPHLVGGLRGLQSEATPAAGDAFTKFLPAPIIASSVQALAVPYVLCLIRSSFSPEGATEQATKGAFGLHRLVSHRTAAERRSEADYHQFGYQLCQVAF